jgi:hypothetical protein
VLWVLCLQFSSELSQLIETEHAYYTDYECAACVETLPSQKNDVTPEKPRSPSTSDLPKKLASPERALVLPAVFDNDKYEMLTV